MSTAVHWALATGHTPRTRLRVLPRPQAACAGQGTRRTSGPASRPHAVRAEPGSSRPGWALTFLLPVASSRAVPGFFWYKHGASERSRLLQAAAARGPAASAHRKRRVGERHEFTAPAPPASQFSASSSLLPSPSSFPVFRLEELWTVGGQAL